MIFRPVTQFNARYEKPHGKSVAARTRRARGRYAKVSICTPIFPLSPLFNVFITAGGCTALKKNFFSTPTHTRAHVRTYTRRARAFPARDVTHARFGDIINARFRRNMSPFEQTVDFHPDGLS